MDLDPMIDNLIQSAHWRTLAMDSYKNYHVEGLTYVNLLRDERMSVKLYLFDGCQINGQGFLAHPHNHSYNFYHKTLVGTIINTRFKIIGSHAVGGTGKWDVWQYATPLRGGEGASQVDLTVGLKAYPETLEAGEGYYLDHKEIHTISTLGGKYAAAVLVQYHDIHMRPTTMFVPTGEQPDCDSGLYEPIHHDEAEQKVTEFLTRWRD